LGFLFLTYTFGSDVIVVLSHALVQCCM
jgi:hypothetical protein